MKLYFLGKCDSEGKPLEDFLKHEDRLFTTKAQARGIAQACEIKLYDNVPKENRKYCRNLYRIFNIKC